MTLDYPAQLVLSQVSMFKKFCSIVLRSWVSSQNKVFSRNQFAEISLTASSRIFVLDSTQKFVFSTRFNRKILKSSRCRSEDCKEKAIKSREVKSNLISSAAECWKWDKDLSPYAYVAHFSGVLELFFREFRVEKLASVKKEAK